jgi:hypothetical protein
MEKAQVVSNGPPALSRATRAEGNPAAHWAICSAAGAMDSEWCPGCGRFFRVAYRDAGTMRFRINPNNPSTISVRPTDPGSGTTFTVNVPLKLAPP